MKKEKIELFEKLLELQNEQEDLLEEIEELKEKCEQEIGIKEGE